MQNAKLTNLLLITMLALCACATPAPSKPVVVPAAKLPPPPAEVMQEHKADFQERLLNFFSISPVKPMK